jgi:hypothetical protein
MSRIALGINEPGSSTAPVNGPKYPVYLISAGIQRKYNSAAIWSLSAEAWYNRGVYDLIVSQEFFDDKWHEKSVAVSVMAGHEFLIGRFGLFTNAGLYLYNPYYRERLNLFEEVTLKSKIKTYVPARIGINYHVKDPYRTDVRNLFFGVYIKSNFGQADFLESTLGFVF